MVQNFRSHPHFASKGITLEQSTAAVVALHFLDWFDGHKDRKNEWDRR